MTELRTEINNSIVEGAAINDIVLIDCTFKTSESFMPDLDSDEIRLVNEAEVRDLSFTEDFLSSRGQFYYKASFSSLDEAKSGSLVVECVYYVYFKFSDNLDGESGEEEKAFFSMRSGVMAAYPFFRQIVASFGASSRVDLPILPLLKTQDVVIMAGGNKEAEPSS